MNKKCLGCGVLLQDENITQPGFTTDINNDICQRCFRMKNYGEYQVVTKSNEEYIDILKSVDETKDLVLYIVDLLNVDKDLSLIRNYMHNKMILVLNKRDVLPKSVKDEKLINYFKNMDINFEDVVVISTTKNYNIDLLLKTIKKYQTTKNVYVVGHTNVGKSSLINKLIQDYSDNSSELTISPLPSTTLNKVEVPLSDSIILIDTPGLVDRGNLVNYIDNETLRKVNPKKEIKPKTYQIKKGQCLVIGDLFRIDYVEGEKNSFTIYCSNSLKVKRYNRNRCMLLKDLSKTSYEIGYHEDIVINGLGFIKIVDKCNVDIYLNKDVETFIRKNLI